MITLVDTTLRDGEQSPGVSFSLEEKVKLAKALSQIGIKEIEAGTPAMGTEEQEKIKAIIALNLPVRILTWNRILEKDIRASLACNVDSLYISCPVSDIQIEKKIRKNRAWVKSRFLEIIPSLKKAGCYIACGLEDASRADTSFLLEVCTILEELKADRIRICDTVGILTPFKTVSLINSIRRRINIPLEIHCHNDFGMATANTLAGIKSGAKYATVTINGIGERAGNAALAEVVMALTRLEGMHGLINTKGINKLSAVLAAAAGRLIPLDKPIVGEYAFTHESKIHVDGVLKAPRTYEPFPPEEAGGERKIICNHSKVHRKNYVR